MTGSHQGDFSRHLFDRRKRYSAVWMQQGRVQLDADWNAQAAILAHRTATGTVDLVGSSGAPAAAAGFAIAPEVGLGFDGEDQIAAIGGEAGFVTSGCEGLTVEVRLRRRPGGGGVVVSQEGAFTLTVDGEGRARYRREGPGALELTSGEPLPAGRVVWLAVADGAGESRLYVDGELAGRGDSPGGPAGAEAPLAVGAALEHEVPHRCFDGVVHALRVWGEARSPEDLPGSASPAAGGGLLGEWVFDRGAGDRVEDRSGHGRPAVLGGGVPAHRPAWELADLEIGPGRYYVGGLLCESEAPATLTGQPDYPGGKVPGPGDHLVYLDVWERAVSALEDPGLQEVALGGATTTVRSRIVAQVKHLPVDGADAADPDPEAALAVWRRHLAAWARRGRLRARRRQPAAATLGNLLYRVEIHSGGGLYGWPRPEDPLNPPVGVQRIAGDDHRRLEVDPEAHELRRWHRGDCLEVYSSNATDLEGPGRPVTLTAIDRRSGALHVGSGLAELAGHSGLEVRRVTTFKWSRSNASVTYPVLEREAGSRVVRLGDLGRGDLALEPGDRIELVDDYSVLQRRAAHLCVVEEVDQLNRRVTLGQIPPSDVGTDPALRPLLRRWDHRGDEGSVAGGALLALPGEWLHLDAGIQVRFEGGAPYRTGDYWWMPARTATQDIEWPRGAGGEPEALAPHGIDHHYCPLALLRCGPEGIEVSDLRRTFRPLSAGEVSKAGDTMSGPLVIRSDLEVTGEARVGALHGELATPGVVHARHLAADALAGIVPAGFCILGETQEAPPGFASTGASLTLFDGPGEWSRRAEAAGGARGPFHSAVVDGVVYTVAESGDLWAYDPAAGSLYRRRDVPYPRRGFAVAAAGGRIHLTGGVDASGTPTGSTLVYDPGADEWSSAQEMPTPRSALALASDGETVFAVGGLRASPLGPRVTGRCEVYDPVTDSWDRRRPLPHPRAALGAVALGGKVYAAGGEGRLVLGMWGRYVSRRLQVYQVAADRWLPAAAPMPTARRQSAVAAANGRLYALGGEAAFGWTGRCEEYDPATDAWAAKAPVPAPAGPPGLAVVGGRLVASGGGGDPAAPAVWVEECPASARLYVHRRA